MSANSIVAPSEEVPTIDSSNKDNQSECERGIIPTCGSHEASSSSQSITVVSADGNAELVSNIDSFGSDLPLSGIQPICMSNDKMCIENTALVDQKCRIEMHDVVADESPVRPLSLLSQREFLNTLLPEMSGTPPTINHVSGRTGSCDMVSDIAENQWPIGETSPRCESSFGDSARCSDVMESTLSLEAENELLSYTNPARISPKIFMQIPDALAAIRAEINALTKLDKDGIPALLCVDFSKMPYKKIQRLHTTMVVKRKSSAIYKARMCIRGDLWKPDVPLDFSAPAVLRCSPKLLLSISLSYGFTVGIVDISSAFIQASLVSEKDRFISIPPWYVKMPWSGALNYPEKKQLGVPLVL